MIEYRELSCQEINRELFRGFDRRQVVGDCWRRENGAWVIRSDPFIDNWSEEDYQFLVKCLRHTVESGGFVLGAFSDGVLKGFTSVEAKPLGSAGQYLDLSCIHVSADIRGNSIGRALFTAASDWARAHGAEKLYISAHSAVESQAFYEAMGCVDAEEYNAAHVEAEPYDRQLEFKL